MWELWTRMPRMSRTPLNVGVVDGDGDFVIYGAGGRLVDEDFVICGAGGRGL